MDRCRSWCRHNKPRCIAQKIRIVNAAYFVRLYLSNGDNAHDEGERCQGYVGDAICDGGGGGGGGIGVETQKSYSMKTVLKNYKSCQQKNFKTMN